MGRADEGEWQVQVNLEAGARHECAARLAGRCWRGGFYDGQFGRRRQDGGGAFAGREADGPAGWEIVAVADRAYASLKLLDQCRKLSDPIISITRLRLDAALYEPAPPRRPHQMGRPRLKGERLPDLSAVAQNPATVWKPTTIANWYGSGERMVEIAS